MPESATPPGRAIRPLRGLWELLTTDHQITWREAVPAAIPPAARRPLLELLVGLRTRRLPPDEFWQSWAALPVDDPSQLEPVRWMVERYLETRQWRARAGREDPERR